MYDFREVSLNALLCVDFYSLLVIYMFVIVPLNPNRIQNYIHNVCKPRVEHFHYLVFALAGTWYL